MKINWMERKIQSEAKEFWKESSIWRQENKMNICKPVILREIQMQGRAVEAKRKTKWKRLGRGQTRVDKKKIGDLGGKNQDFFFLN